MNDRDYSTMISPCFGELGHEHRRRSRRSLAGSPWPSSSSETIDGVSTAGGNPALFSLAGMNS